MSEQDEGDRSAPLEPAEIDALLATLDERPVEEHVAVYDQVHRRLRDQLT